jgi:hypothetical protein
MQEREHLLASSRAVQDRLRFTSQFDPRSLHLRPEYLDVYLRNPHLQQVFVNLRPFEVAPRPLHPATDRVLTDASPRSAYVRRQHELKSSPWSTGDSASC